MDIHFAEDGLLWIETTAEIETTVGCISVPIQLWFEHLRPPEAWRETVRIDDVVIDADDVAAKLLAAIKDGSLMLDHMEKQILKTIQAMRDEAADR